MIRQGRIISLDLVLTYGSINATLGGKMLDLPYLQRDVISIERLRDVYIV